MLTKTLSEAKKKQRASLIKAMNNDIGSIDSAKDSWNPAQISERAKDISYIRSLVDSWNPAQLNEALKMLDLPVIDTWNPAQIEEQRRNLVFYLAERTLTGNPITLKILGNLTTEITGLKVTMNPIQDLHGYDKPWAGGAWKNMIDLNINTSVNSGSIVFDTPITETVTISAKKNDVVISDAVWLIDILMSDDTHVYIGDTGYIAPFPQTIIATPSKSIVKLTYRNYGIISGSYDIQMEKGSTATSFAPYSNICPISGRTEVSVTRTAGEDVETKTHEYNETIWWGEDDFKNGGMEVIGAEIASYDGETLSGEWMSDRDVYAPDTTPTTGAQVVYKNTPTTIETTPEEITLLKGTNVLSTDGDSIELKYKQNF